MIASPSLGFILLGIAGMLGWSLLLKKKWMQPVRQREYATVGGYVVIGIVSMGLAIYPYLGHKQPASQPITATNQNSPGGIAIGENKGKLEIHQSDPNATKETNEKLDVVEEKLDRLLSMTQPVMDRLKRDYPLGVVLVAFSGESHEALPVMGVIEGDWYNLKVRRTVLGGLAVLVPFLRDTRVNVKFYDVVLSVDRALPGATRMNVVLGNVTVWVECVKQEPIGICAAVGFRETEMQR